MQILVERAVSGELFEQIAFALQKSVEFAGARRAGRHSRRNSREASFSNRSFQALHVLILHEFRGAQRLNFALGTAGMRSSRGRAASGGNPRMPSTSR